MLADFALAIGQSMVLDGHWTGIFPGLFHNRSLSDTEDNKLIIYQLCACGGWPLVNIR